MVFEAVDWIIGPETEAGHLLQRSVRIYVGGDCVADELCAGDLLRFAELVQEVEVGFGDVDECTHESTSDIALLGDDITYLGGGLLDVGFGRGWTALEQARVDGQEEGLGVGERCAIGGEEVGGVEEFAGAFATKVAGGEGEGGVERCGTEVVDGHVAGHGEEAEGTVELAHGFVEQGGDDAAVDVAGRALVEFGELDGGGGGDLVFAGRWLGVDGEAEVEALGIGGAAAEAVGGEFVDGEVVELFGVVGHAG